MIKIRDFILQTVENFYGSDEVSFSSEDIEILNRFVHDVQYILLQVAMCGGKLHCILQFPDEYDKSIIFYKTARLDLSKEETVKNINVITLSNTAAETLYLALRQVFTPIFGAGDSLKHTELQKYLSELETNLRIFTHGKGENPDVILDIADELSYWKMVAQKNNTNKKEKEAAAACVDIFEEIAVEIRLVQTGSYAEGRDAVENIGGLLDDLWRNTSYSEKRMKHMLDIIGYTICSKILKALTSFNVWNINEDNEILSFLSENLKMINTWTAACRSLTGTYWPNYALRPWNGVLYISQYCTNLEERLREINDIRSIYSQLNKLLTKNERTELKTHLLFEPFQNVNVWICNSVNKEWGFAVDQFWSNLRPTELKVSEKLKPRLRNNSTKQILYEFLRYKTLISRPVVKAVLNNELEVFASSLVIMLKSIESQMESDDEVDVQMYQPPEMSQLVQRVQWAKQMESKVKDIKCCSEKYLKDFHSSHELVRLSEKLLKDLKSMYTQLNEEWSQGLQRQSKNGALRLALDKPVVEFSTTTRLMVVNFNPKLVWIELEARAMAALGLPVPPAATVMDTLTAALKHARALQQVASFHNTLGERMIPSTRPMMLQAALDLSSLVQEQKSVYWDNEDQLTTYTNKLKQAVFKLESQNSYLTNQHMIIRSIVVKLADTELLAKQSEWKKKVQDIRGVIETVELNGYKNTELWRSHWDWQLYKSLECQYIKTLLSLHQHFPHISVDLVLRGHSVRVQPPLEEIRVQHYHQLRRLIAIPSHFVGLQTSITDQKNIFAAIVEKHGWLGNIAVGKLESALACLERTCDEWTRRAALACVPDLHALCTQYLNEPNDWEVNFKACKAYGQAVAKMTFEDEKIEWISVGTAALRREFEAQARNLWVCLMSSLQTSCRNDVSALDTFIASAKVALEDKTLPKNAKELAAVSAKQHALQEKMPEMEKTIDELKRKSHLLRTWGGDTSIESSIKEWQKIRDTMISQKEFFEHQAEIVKSNLSGEWDNLNVTIEAWISRWIQTKARFEEIRDVQYTEMLDRCRSVFDAHTQWIKFVADRDELMSECEKFNMKHELSQSWIEAEKLITVDLNLWSILNEYNNELDSIAGQEWIVFQKKLHLLDEFISKWRGCLEPYTFVTLYIQQELDKYVDLTTSLKYLRGSDFTERHWREVLNLLNIEYKKPDTLVVRDFLVVAEDIKKHLKTLQKISASASSESAIRATLNELELWFAGAKLLIIYYNDSAKRKTPIVKDYKEIISKVEEQQWALSSATTGSTDDSGTDPSSAWGSRLRAARALLHNAHHAQRRWLYLEPILTSDDGELGVKFRKVDQGFRQVARILEADPRLTALVQSSRLQPMLDSISDQLLTCQSALNQYIDDKRSIFPRLYFLSDDDLLELLGQARAGAEGREVVMQTHLKKLFPGITGVRLGPENLSITALCSHHGEIFQLDHPVDIDCPVEVWLKNIENEMRSSLRNITLKCVVSESLKNQDPFSLPTQILCLVQNIRFTQQAESALASKTLHRLKDSIEKENIYYSECEVDDDIERNKRQAVMLQCAHYIGVVQALIDNNVTTASDWHWQKQLRFYVLDTKEVVAKMGLSQIAYSYEYLGANTGHFVRTEQNDECFLLLTQSLHLGFIGNPFGPAGTGKTESVKALGGLLGRLVLVFNCDESLDSQCLGRLLTGLAKCGAWGCFDEFNRLSMETLAAASHLFSSLLAAILRNTPTAILNGKRVTVSEWCGVVVTMNPAGRGYGGRRELPAALQRVMRPCAVVQNDGDKLAGRLLAARAVPHYAILAADLRAVFSIARTLLSNQRHYDWGLRAIKAAVGSCAAMLSACPSEDVTEARSTLRHVLCLNNLSKLTKPDAVRFRNILSLVFGDERHEKPSSGDLRAALEESVKSLGLVHNSGQIQKCMELYEQLQQRMGVVMVGPPGSGKSTIKRLLKHALTKQNKTIMEYTIYPKAMSRKWLLGHIDHDTRQWTDGVISSTALEVSNQPPDIWSWMEFVGDIDPEWVEALNSVLDDNRLLTLPSGWRIQFSYNVNFIFETHSLEHASPATISRMGIILLSDDSNCANEVLENWLQITEFENENAKMALPLLKNVIKKCIHWFDAHRSELIVKIDNVALVKQILAQFENIVQSVNGTTQITPEEIIYLSVQRGVISLIKQNAVDSFHQDLSEMLGPPVMDAVMAAPAEWVSETLLMSPRISAAERALRAYLTCSDGHLLLVAPPATAANSLVEYILKESNTPVMTLECTPMLEPHDVISELKRKNVVLSRSSGGGVKVGGNSRVIVFVKELHRAQIDAWGSCMIHAFFEQLIKEHGFWSCDGEDNGAQWCSTAHVRLVATAAPRQGPTLGALSALCCTSYLSDPDDEETLELVKHYLTQSVDKSIPDRDVSVVAATMLTMYKEVTEMYYSKPHYSWDCSHLRRWCDNIELYSPTNVESFTTAVYAESNVVFQARLTTDEEKYQFSAVAKRYFRINEANDLQYFLPKLRNERVHIEQVEQRDWNEITNKIINQCISENEESIFGHDGIEVNYELNVLCAAIARACNGGVTVCVARPGVGRRGAARIVATSLPATLVILNHQRQLNSQIRNVLTSAGEGTRTLLVISESAVDCNTLSCIETLRRTHDVHSLPAQWLPTHIQSSHSLMNNIKQYLGIVICLDKSEDNLFDLIEKYPLIHENSHLVWLDHWSETTLREVPTLIVQRLTKENFDDEAKEKIAEIPVEGFVKIYKSLNVEWKRAPCRYVNLIKSYYHIVNKKRTMLVQRRDMLLAGVEALRNARVEVGKLEKEANEQKAAFSEKQEKANQALDQISATVQATTDKKEEMHALKKNIENENEKLQIRKKEIETELASVQPVIEAARAAVGDIRPESLSEVRSLRAPPDVVRDVLEGVLRLMGIADTSWHSMKSFLSKRGVKEDIRCLDASQISEEALASVERLLNKRGASFEEKTARRASAACAPLAAWVRANVAHARVLARVAPLQVQQRELHRNLQEAESQLEALSSGLLSVDERVAALKVQLSQYTRDAAAIELSLERVTDTLRAARDLLQHLAQEYVDWQSDLEVISKEISELTVRSLLAAAYVVYLPDVTDSQADEFVRKWSVLLGFEDDSYSVVNFLLPTEKQLKWEADGLPTDKSAVKNAVIIDQMLEDNKCGFTPVIIDPDGDAMIWLKATLATSNCDFVSQHSDRLPTAVQFAARLGRILVITDVEAVDHVWASLLSGVRLEGVGGACSKNTRVLLYCRESMRMSQYHAARLSLVRFTATRDSLTDLLVHHALQHHNSELYEKSKEIKMKKAELQKQQYELQENLLKDLSTKHDILHDENLLASLKKTRETSSTISSALEAAKNIEAETRSACDVYVKAAYKVALLTLAVKRLSIKRPLLNLPIDVALDVFIEALEKQKARIKTVKSLDTEDVVKCVMRRILERVLLSVRKRDKYIIILHLIKQVYEDIIPEQLWKIFCGSYDFNEDQNIIMEMKKNYPWIPKECIKKVVHLKMTNEQLYTKLTLDNTDMWTRFENSGELGILNSLNLTPFEVVTAVVVLRPSSLYRAVVAFVDQTLGASVNSICSNVMSAVRWSTRSRSRVLRPVLVLAPHAADVLAASPNRTLIQVGIEEGREAWEEALKSTRGGGWLALLIGASPFTRDLQTFLTDLTAAPIEDIDPEFRLWLVSEEREIPPPIANICVNVILEAPEGVKNNTLGTLGTWGAYSSTERLVRAHGCLALLHALVQQRRSYIPQGWSRWYAWEWGEIEAVRRCWVECRGGSVARELSLVLYSARVPIPTDRKLLVALVQQNMGEQAFGNTWRPRGMEQSLPYTKQLQAYMSSFATLPDLDSPQLLGLPANCRLAWEKNTADIIVKGLKELSSTVELNHNIDNMSHIKTLLAMWKKLMSGCPLIKGDYISSAVELDGWWGCVCGGELMEAAACARALHAALARIARAHSSALPTLHRTPEEWQSLWAGDGSPDLYLREFTHRARAAVARISASNIEHMPQEVDLRSFLRPERVICALRMHHAQQLGVSDPMRLKLVVDILADTEHSSDRETSGLIVKGLNISGAELKEMRLQSGRECSPHHVPAPPLLLRYTQQMEGSGGLVDHTLEVPVYTNEAREEVVFEVQMPLSRDYPRDVATLNAIAFYIAPVD